jgi:hypothetical protein
MVTSPNETTDPVFSVFCVLCGKIQAFDRKRL